MRRLGEVGPGLPAVLALMMSALAFGPGAAQVSEVRAEVGASRIVPPAGVEGGGADFLVAGLRASSYDVLGSGGYVSFLLGRSLDAATGGDFVSGELGGTSALRLGRGWSAEIEGRASGFGVASPFAYQAVAAEASTALRWRTGPISARLVGSGGVGRSRVTLSTLVQRMRRQVPVRQILTDDLWRYGAALEVLATRGPVSAGVAGATHETAGGSYRSVGARLVVGGTHGAVELRVDTWRTPGGTRNTGGVAFWVPWGPWSARGMAGRPEPDPLLLAEPGNGSGGILVGRRILGRPSPGNRVPLYEVEQATAGGAHVRFDVNAPAQAERVEILGDFTLWEPVAMSRHGRRWSLEMDVRSGTYHFGFLVDGEWYVPDAAADVVPDEWGRRSATLVIEGEAGS